MKFFAALIAALVIASSPLAQAQPGGAPPPEAAQFDFLVGQWELEVTPKVNGLAAAIHGTPRLVGSWKAWRAFDGRGVMDELRVFDASGNPVALTQAMRVYDANARQWQLQSLDVYRARFGPATAQWQGNEMRINGTGTNPDGKKMLTRTRFYEIGADRFRMQQDRSMDDGATWDEAALVITARRVAKQAPR